MELKSISLTNFRSYTKETHEFGRGVNVILGPNGAGKTNLLEAIYMTASGRSFRADVESEVIRYGETYSRIQCSILTAESRLHRNLSAGNIQETKLEIQINDGSLGYARKKFMVNGVARRMIDFVGNLRAVIFGPWDMELLTGSPSRRRNYLDFILSLVDMEYRRSVAEYEKGIRRRNKILEAIREGVASRNQLFFWNKLLIKNGEYITDKRSEYSQFLVDQVNQVNPEIKFLMKYDKSVISDARLSQYEREETAAAATLVGPHRDDFAIEYQESNKNPDEASAGSLDGRNVAKFGSRGEQRMAILWLKMGELSFIERKSGSRPVLLLDDIFSELDHAHREAVFNVIEKQQTIITSADEHLISSATGQTIILPGRG